jgi:hypothetical protein
MKREINDSGQAKKEKQKSNKDTKMQWETAKHRPVTHIVLCIFVGPRINQQPHTLRVTIRSGVHQRRESVL